MPKPSPMQGLQPRTPLARTRTRPCRALALVVLLAALGGAALAAQAGKELLRSEFWADIEPVPGTGEEWPVSAASARSRILDEAAWVYGGMIWGFDFSYTPYDRTRAVPERFDLSPIESLQPRLLSLVGLKAGGDFRAFVEYRPQGALVSLMESYSGDPWKGAQGIGRADMNLGVKGRKAAYTDGLRAAVRSLLQGLEPNKPRLVRGRVVFDRPPGLSLQEGQYTAGVKARAMVVELLPYTVF